MAPLTVTVATRTGSGDHPGLDLNNVLWVVSLSNALCAGVRASRFASAL